MLRPSISRKQEGAHSDLRRAPSTLRLPRTASLSRAAPRDRRRAIPSEANRTSAPRSPLLREPWPGRYPRWRCACVRAAVACTSVSSTGAPYAACTAATRLCDTPQLMQNPCCDQPIARASTSSA